ncbi:hypothetical protein IEU95_06990 [Hoyosella rhizosphaerae]|uniref:MmpS family membrane protein n=1 Tax=Hoyosella rhizosphaerae TaxID=1755582 RepID=A0A916U3T9_9ACTN|nr:hypothetical protein [Hoyosella rhizosphaerae]MBN4926567.1 hypothetical protein [Hoyosella rhizosphaerae]GGC58230.1 hypothetical protein GCM10011410_08410 [Hoyosella rhizosphaerae]
MKNIARTLTATALTATAVISLSGCSDIAKPFSDAWAIHYYVDTTDADTGSASLTYLGSDKRGADSTERTDIAAQLPWTEHVVITDGQPAEITATPAANETLTCRILLDDIKVLAETTGTPGETITCTATPTAEETR